MPVYLLFCIGLIFAFVRKIKKDAQIVENSQQREFNLMKSIIENFGELGFVDKSHISLNGNSIAYQKLQTMKKITTSNIVMHSTETNCFILPGQSKT